MSTRAAAAAPTLGILTLLAVVCLSWQAIGAASAVELVDRNLFDPQRRPWKAPPPPQPEMPVLTPQDLQIEAIVAFGPMRGIIAQLDGKLRGSLPANAAGKVRIAVGQSFGAGYLLESVDANQAVVQGGNARYTIPVLRKVTRGSAPLPATLAVDQRIAPPPVASPPFSAPGTVGAAPAPPLQSGTFMAPVAPAAAPPPMAAQASSEAIPPAIPPAPIQQPMSLLEAIQAAQAAARNQQGAAPPIVNPFAVPKK